jgi:hypothetical protein
MTVRWLASRPEVTSSAVDAEPKPDGPGSPHSKPHSPIAASFALYTNLNGSKDLRDLYL